MEKLYFCQNLIFNPMRRALIHFLWSVLAIAIVTTVLAFVAIWNGWIGYMPPINDLQNPIGRFATQVYSSDGKVIGTWNLNKENRIAVPYDKISPYLIKALVATEDERFYEHSGIDFIALGRAIVKRGILRSEEHTSELQSRQYLVCRLLLEKKHNPSIN